MQYSRATTQDLTAVRALRARQHSKTGIVPAQREGGSMNTTLRAGLCSTLLVVGLIGLLWGTADAAMAACGSTPPASFCTCNTDPESSFTQIICLPTGAAQASAPCPAGDGMLGVQPMAIFGVGGKPAAVTGLYACPGAMPIMCLNNNNPLNPSCLGVGFAGPSNSPGICSANNTTGTSRLVITCATASGPTAPSPTPPSP